MSSSTLDRKITPADIEARIRGLLPGGEAGTPAAAVRENLPIAAAVGIVVVAVVVGVAFLMGRRKGRRRSTFVEIKRI